MVDRALRRAMFESEAIKGRAEARPSGGTCFRMSAGKVCLTRTVMVKRCRSAGARLRCAATLSQMNVICLRARLRRGGFGRVTCFGQELAQQLPRLGPVPLPGQT